MIYYLMMLLLPPEFYDLLSITRVESHISGALSLIPQCKKRNIHRSFAAAAYARRTSVRRRESGSEVKRGDM